MNVKLKKIFALVVFTGILATMIFLIAPASFALAAKKVEGTVPHLEPLQPAPPGFFEEPAVSNDNDPNSAAEAAQIGINPQTFNTTQQPGALDSVSQPGAQAGAQAALGTESSSRRWILALVVLFVLGAAFALWMHSRNPDHD